LRKAPPFREVLLTDSTRIFQSSLAEIGRTVGLEKAKGTKTIDYLKKRFIRFFGAETPSSRAGRRPVRLFVFLHTA